MSERHETPPPPKLLDRLRAKTRLLHSSIRTEEAYAAWGTKFILFHHKRHPKDMGAPEVEAFLTHLAADRQLAASTQNQATRPSSSSTKKSSGSSCPRSSSSAPNGRSGCRW